ncbi:hypothetical protein ACGFI3_46270 [Nonomuraea wenchangensis]|uniref:hypothetical protein n=1 Tax=Nonomuraea wenchangensis TaxID=568860 RepID=UPI003717C121
MSATGSQYAFVIQTRDDLDRSWSWITDYGTADKTAVGRGVIDDAPGSPQDFGRATFDAYLDRLVATSPEAVEYFLFDDDADTQWRIQVWDIPATGYDQRSAVPPPGDRVRLQYPLVLVADGIEPQATSTWPGAVVRKRLQDKQAARQDELIWCEVHLDDVADVLGSYELWKDGPWYHLVDWRRVCEEFGDFLQRNAVDGVVTDLSARLCEIEDRLGQREREGLLALVLEPITVTQVQLTNGGHRLIAMREQGVRFVPGLFVRGDVGASITADQVYPTSQA